MSNPFLDISHLGEPLTTRDKNELRFNCIYCEDEGFHLYLNTAKGVFHCFRCDTRGRTNCRTTDLEAIHLIRGISNKTLERSIGIKLPIAHKDLITPTALKYLVRRGVLESDVEKWKMYCAAPLSKYFGRLIIPYCPTRGYAAYFVARGYTNLVFPKYLNPPGGRDTLFFGPPIPSNSDEQYWNLDELVLVEGPFDCIKACRHGPAAALLGKSMKPSQARIVAASFTKVYILLDNEGTKNRLSSLEIKDLLKIHVDVEILTCPKKDPGDMNHEDFRELFGG